MISNSVMWELTKDFNSFLVKKGGKVFSKDPLNLTGKNMFKYSVSAGIAHERAMGLNAETKKTEKGYKIQYKLDIKNRKKYPSAKNITPKKNKSKFLSKNKVNKNIHATAQTLLKMKYFRPDLQKAALRRMKATTKAAALSIRSKTIKK